MDLGKEVDAILFELIKSIKIHRIDSENTVIDIDYNEYTAKILKLFKDYLLEE
jgi:hypothetical protein